MLTTWHFSSVASKIERGFAFSREILLGRKWHLLIPDHSQKKKTTDDNMRLNMTEVNVALLSYYTYPDSKFPLDAILTLSNPQYDIYIVLWCDNDMSVNTSLVFTR